MEAHNAAILTLVAGMLVAMVTADVRHRGTCPALPETGTLADFEPERFSGMWYAISAFDPDAACLTFNYTVCGPRCLRVEEWRQLDIISNIGLSNVYQREGILQMKENDTAVMTSAYTDTRATPEFRVLATDYDQYAAVYRCQNVSLGPVSLFHRRSVLVLHRERNGTLSDRQVHQLGEIMIENEIEDEAEAVKQHQCIRSEDAAVDINTSRLVQRVASSINSVANGVNSLVSGALSIFGIGNSG